VGAGFGGLAALAGLAVPGIHATLVDRNSYSTFQPLLYQVATAGLTSSDVAYPLWTAARKAKARFRKGEFAGLDTGSRQVLLADGAKLDYDYLIVATGVGAAFYGVTGAAEHSLSLYTRRDAITLRQHLMAELESRSTGEDHRELNIMIVGGGATGVELAGTVAELRNIALPAAFRAASWSSGALTSGPARRSRKSSRTACCWPTVKSCPPTSRSGQPAWQPRSQVRTGVCPAAMGGASAPAPTCGSMARTGSSPWATWP